MNVVALWHLVSDITIEENQNEASLVLQNENGTRVGAPLRSRDFSIDIGQAALDKLKTILELWGEKRKEIVNFYLSEKREVDSFIYDLLALAHFTSQLHVEHEHLIGNWNPPDLLHDRIVAQLLHELSSIGYDVESKVSNTIGEKNHDFNASIFRCEVKTFRIQVNAPLTMRGVWLEPDSRERISARIRQEFYNARKQVGDDGIIYMAPLSSNLNSLFRGYFKRQLLNNVPPPNKGTVNMILSSQTPFKDTYLTFKMDRFLLFVEKALSDSQAYGLRGFTMFTRWPMSLTTAARKGSSIVFSPRGN